MLLKHNSRTLTNDSNHDINPLKTSLNREIPCIDGLTELQAYHQLIGESYLYGRGTSREKESITCCSIIVTLPKTVSDYSTLKENEVICLNPEKENQFFQAVLSFFQERYQGSCFSCRIHYDERACGQPHAHILLVPRVTLNHDHVHYKTTKTKKAIKTASGRYEYEYQYKKDSAGNRIPLKNYAKISDLYDYKLSAAQIFNRAELQHLHPDLAAYLKKNHIPGADDVYTGTTAGKNVSVSSLKALTDRTGLTLTEIKDLQQTISDLQKQVNVLTTENQQLRANQEHTWGENISWNTPKKEIDDYTYE